MSFYPVNGRRSDGIPQGTGWRFLGALAVTLMTCGGCWEEIHYTPSPSAAKSGATESIESAPAPDAAEAAPLDGDSEAASAMEAAPETPSADSSESTTPATDPPSSAPPPEVKSATPYEQLLAWRAVSKWSLAAAAYAKGLDESRYEQFRQEAAEAADELSLGLPELPTTDDNSQREAAVIDSLRSGAGAKLTDSVREQFGPQAGAAARLAVGSHLLLLVYSPEATDAASHVLIIREAAEASGLPAELWLPLAQLLEKQAEYLTVRSAVFELHRQVEEHFGRL